MSVSAGSVLGPILFTGDSITDCGRRDDPLGLGNGYVDLLATELAPRGEHRAVINTGVSGNRVGQLRDRWDEDVLAHRPSVLSILIGVNDTLVAFFQGRAVSVVEFEERVTDILSRAVAAGVPRILVLEPFLLPTDDRAAQWWEGQDFARADLDTKLPILRSAAAAHGAAWVPLQAAFDTAAAERGASLIAPDGVHPSPIGHRVIAREWLRAFDLSDG